MQFTSLVIEKGNRTERETRPPKTIKFDNCRQIDCSWVLGSRGIDFIPQLVDKMPISRAGLWNLNDKILFILATILGLAATLDISYCSSQNTGEGAGPCMHNRAVKGYNEANVCIRSLAVPVKWPLSRHLQIPICIRHPSRHQLLVLELCTLQSGRRGPMQC